MELEHLRGRPMFVKVLTKTDVDDRLVLPNEVLFMLPPEDPEHGTPIRVLDDEGDVYQFYLSVRKGPHLKPVFQAKGWQAFIKKRGAEVKHTICFWPEVNAIKHTDYGIKLYPFRCYLFPEPEGLSSSGPSAPADERETLATRGWAVRVLPL